MYFKLIFPFVCQWILHPPSISSTDDWNHEEKGWCVDGDRIVRFSCFLIRLLVRLKNSFIFYFVLHIVVSMFILSHSYFTVTFIYIYAKRVAILNFFHVLLLIIISASLSLSLTHSLTTHNLIYKDNRMQNAIRLLWILSTQASSSKSKFDFISHLKTGDKLESR